MIVQKAKELVADGMRLTIVRTSTGDSLTVHELEEEIAHAKGA